MIFHGVGSPTIRDKTSQAVRNKHGQVGRPRGHGPSRKDDRPGTGESGGSRSRLPQHSGSTPPHASGAMAMPQDLWHRIAAPAPPFPASRQQSAASILP